MNTSMHVSHDHVILAHVGDADDAYGVVADFPILA